MQSYSETEKLKYYGSRKSNKRISSNQREFAKDRYQILKNSVIPKFFKKFSLKSVQTNSGTIMSISDVIETIRSKKDINVRGMAREGKQSVWRNKLNNLYNEDLNKLDSFMIKNKLSSKDKLYFKN